jgi:hypothetical protein
MDPHMATSVQYRHQVGVIKITILLLTAVVWCFATRRWEVLLGLGGNLAEVQRLVWSQSHRRPISDATEEGKSDPPQVAAIQLAWT